MLYVFNDHTDYDSLLLCDVTRGVPILSSTNQLLNCVNTQTVLNTRNNL